MEDKFNYFIERTDERLSQMELTLSTISKALVNMNLLQTEVVELKAKVQSLVLWRAWIAGAALVIGGIGGVVIQFLMKG